MNARWRFFPLKLRRRRKNKSCLFRGLGDLVGWLAKNVFLGESVVSLLNFTTYGPDHLQLIIVSCHLSDYNYKIINKKNLKSSKILRKKT